jgi:hypothetical protein
MFSQFLRRLPEEHNRAIWYPFDENTQRHLTTGETFYFAFETDETNSVIKPLRTIYSDATGPMIIRTSSNLEFKIGDKIEFEGKLKAITDISNFYTQPDLLRSVDFQPVVQYYYKELFLS